MRGGRRDGAGRPVGSTARKSGWVKFSTKISPAAKAFLDRQRRDGFLVSRIVDRAILSLERDASVPLEEIRAALVSHKEMLTPSMGWEMYEEYQQEIEAIERFLSRNQSAGVVSPSKK